MSHSQSNARFALRARWERLSIRTKLLVPVIVALLASLVIVLARVLPPINALAEEHARDSYMQSMEEVDGNASDFFDAVRQDVAALMNSPEVAVYTNADPDPSSVVNVNARTNLEWQMTRHLNATLSFLSWHFVSADGQRVVHAEQTSVNTDDPQVFWATRFQAADGKDYLNKILSMPQGQMVVLPATTYVPPNAALPEPLIQIGIPVYKGNSAVGVVVGAVHARSFLNEAMGLNKFATYTMMLLDQRNRIVVMFNPADQTGAHILGDPNVERVASRLPQNLRANADRSLTIADGQVYSTLHLKTPQGFAPLDWMVVTNEAESSVFGNVQNLLLGNMLTLDRKSTRLNSSHI